MSSSTASNTSNANGVANKRAEQMKKLKDANNKYKDLLKMAKERIQSQEEEMEKLKGVYLKNMDNDCFHFNRF